MASSIHYTLIRKTEGPDGESVETAFDLIIDYTLQRAEPDVGIMSDWAEDIVAWLGDAEFELTEDEQELVAQHIAEGA